MSRLFHFFNRLPRRFLARPTAACAESSQSRYARAVRCRAVRLHLPAKRRPVGIWLGLALGLTFGTCSVRGQALILEFLAEGPGAVVVRCPPPYIAGQGLILQAQGLPNTRFLRWEDGSTLAERFLVVGTNQTQFTAYFEDVNAAAFLAGLVWDHFDPAGRAHAQYPLVSGRTKLAFTSGARQTYQVFRATDLAAGYFTQIPFAVSATGPVNVGQRLAEAGLVEVWVVPPTNTAYAYYKFRLDGAITYPSLYFSQASNAPPGASMYLYGEGLSGAVTAWAGSNAIAATSVNDTTVRVTLPSTAGTRLVTVAVNSFLALGTLSINVSTSTNPMPAVTSIASLPAESGGVLEVAGRNLTTASEFFLDGRRITSLNVSPGGTNAVLLLPVNFGGSHQLTVVNQGSIGSPLTVSLNQDTYSYFPATRKGARVYTWAAEQPNAYTLNPATGKGVRVFSWEISQPNAYSYTPGTRTGARVYAWEPYQPGSYTFAPATVRGVMVQGK